MPTYSDLHLHSYFSDGFYSPKELIGLAAKKKLKAISITDHNYLRNLNDFKILQKIAANKKIQLVEGIEISTKFRDIDIHLLGYSKKFKNRNLLDKKLKPIRNGYQKRGLKILAKIREMGHKIDLKDFKKHKYIFLNSNLISWVCSNKFGKSIDFWKKIRVQENGDFMMNTTEAIALITKADGLSIVAHPGQIYKKHPKEFEDIFIKLIGFGLNGVEFASRQNDSKKMLKILKELKKRYSLIFTGGSDFHGEAYSKKNKHGAYGLSEKDTKYFLKLL
jgi:hypothetical protein